jgi:hypothetical protein
MSSGDSREGLPGLDSQSPLSCTPLMIVPPYSADPPRAMKLLGLASALLCPPSLMLVSPLTIYEPPYAVGGPGLWLIVVLVNSVFYAVIGAPCLGVRKKSDGAATS